MCFLNRFRLREKKAEQLLASPYLLIGSIEQTVERIQRLRERHSISYFVIDSEEMESFGPVVARLANM